MKILFFFNCLIIFYHFYYAKLIFLTSSKTSQTDISGAATSGLYFLRFCISREISLFIKTQTDVSGATSSGLYIFLHYCIIREYTLSIEKSSWFSILHDNFFLNEFMSLTRRKTSWTDVSARREFLREIHYNNTAKIAIQHSKIYFVDTFGDFFNTVEWNSLKFVWQISLYILA